MISSSSPALERGLDTMLIVYSLLQKHPAATVCEQFIRSQTGWFTTPLAIFEAKAVLTKVYGVPPTLASQELLRFVAAPVVLLDIDEATSLHALTLADSLNIDLTDALLLQVTQQNGATWLATEDQRLAQACSQLGITPVTPLDAALRQQIAAWESVNLPSKGLSRGLRRIHNWLSQTRP